MQNRNNGAPQKKRIQTAYEIRKDAAKGQRDMPVAIHQANGDEERYPNKIASFSKGLPHDDLGIVDPKAFKALLNAVHSEKPEDFAAIPLAGNRKLVNPQAGLAYEMEGPDSNHVTVPPAPAFASAEEAGEIAENYWMSLIRDTPFTEYETSKIVRDAAKDISALSDFRGPKQDGKVTPQTLFRGSTPGDVVGPFVSQFMLHDAAFGPQTIKQTMKTVEPGRDYMVDYESWLAIQRGQRGEIINSDAFDKTPRYIRNGRDLGQYVHVDALYQAYFNACLLLLQWRAPVDRGNPYLAAANQDAFGTFGAPHILSLVTEVATRALKAVWRQKWFVHRRLRPEVFAGRIHNHKTGKAAYDIHADILSRSAVLEQIFQKYGTYLLPMAFPEGSPLHPAYGTGHGAVAGACVTVLKAWFDENTLISDLVTSKVASPDGLSLVDYDGADVKALTVGAELNKVAANVAVGRNIAGVHWRSDYTAAVRLGEQVAIGVLKDYRSTYNERFDGFSLTTFGGETITV